MIRLAAKPMSRYFRTWIYEKFGYSYRLANLNMSLMTPLMWYGMVW